MLRIRQSRPLSRLRSTLAVPWGRAAQDGGRPGEWRETCRGPRRCAMPERLSRAIPTLLACLFLMLAGSVLAADCGGTTPCSCGDTVVSSRTLVAGVDPVTTTACTAPALIVAGGVRLDLGGATIQGTGGPQDPGISIPNGLGVPSRVIVTNGRITGFHVGIRSPMRRTLLSFLHIVGTGSL